MTGDRELLREIDPARAHELLSREDGPVLVDIRERSEWETGWIDGALRIPMSELSDQLEEHRDRTLVVYCAHGNRSLRVADALAEAGYGDPVSLAGGIVAWERAGLPVETPSGLGDEQRRRYSRHLLIPEIGQVGQQRLLEASVLLVGAGGLGSPATLYLAAAGVGRLGIVDDDVVDETNLQRQVLHSIAALDEPKVDSAVRRVRELNPDVEVVPYRERLGTENVDRILDEGWEVIVDGADNFPTRYLLNDASVWHGVPVVHGSIFRFEGQATVFAPKGTLQQTVTKSVGPGPCYRCLFPQPPPPELAPSCAEGGVLGVLPGVIGSIQGAEALKLVLGIGEPLVGRLLLYDALAGSFAEVAVRRDPACPVCGDSPSITEYVDYVEFCGRSG
jgi:sulfur-carrier protein adenylyltransferase/sulfurtransferase